MSSIRWSVGFASVMLCAASAHAGYKFEMFTAPRDHDIVRGSSGNLAFGYAFNSGGDVDHAGYWPDGPSSTFFQLDSLPNVPNSTNTQVVWGSDGKQLVGWSGDLKATLWNVGDKAPHDLTPNGFANGILNGVSNGVQTGAVWRSFGTGPGSSRATYWRGTAASAISIHPAGYYSSYARAIDGDYIVGEMTRTQGTDHAAFWTVDEGTLVDLNPKGYYYSYATAVRGDQIVGVARPNGTAFPNQHAMLWSVSGGGVTDLNPKGYVSSYITATNGKVQIGGGEPDGDPNHEFHLLLWEGSAESVVDLNPYLPEGFDPAEVNGINEDGVIVGWGSIYDPAVGGQFRSFALIPDVPEPSAVSLLAITSAILLRRRSRHATSD